MFSSKDSISSTASGPLTADFAFENNGVDNNDIADAASNALEDGTRYRGMYKITSHPMIINLALVGKHDGLKGQVTEV